MAPSAISNDPVSQLEAKSAVILEAANTDITSNPHFEAVKPALSAITTEIKYDDSTGPNSATDGFINTPPSDFAVQEPAQAVAADGFVDATSKNAAVKQQPADFAVQQPATQVPVDGPVQAPADVQAPTNVVKKVVEAPQQTFAPAAVQAPEASKIRPNQFLPLNAIVPSVSEPMSGAKKLRKMIFETNELIICPGVYDGLSARTAIEVGFNAMYMTGAGTTASRLGQPDLAIAQLHEMRENAEMIANLDPFGPPLIADMDTGYGGPIMAARTVEQYIRAGVAGAHLEDQVLMKRCGHLGGKRVVPADEYIARIRAAHAARVRLQSDFVLIARTDALQTLGYDECIRRLRMARDEGADVGLLEGFTSKEQAAQAVQDLAPWPLLLNSVENGKSPLITVDEARKMGFRIMIFSFASIAPAYVAIRETLIRLRDQGVVGTPPDITPVKLFEVCGLKHSMAVDMNAGGASFDSEL
ncbi:Pyruvate/Phosphoenolpyruvate kinase-like domain-containing protein [Xylariaceae sp. FL0594]|nr:Pyruvate/Phosphoenolpyruvate kinase-like domain-containing protein [Xylariaceae sp. FL0594]